MCRECFYLLPAAPCRADLEVSPGDTLAVIGGTHLASVSTGSASTGRGTPHDKALKDAPVSRDSEGEGGGKQAVQEDNGTEREDKVVVDTEQGMVVLHPNLLVSGSRVSYGGAITVS